jgi:hypothetical protein
VLLGQAPGQEQPEYGNPDPPNVALRQQTDPEPAKSLTFDLPLLAG